MIAMTDANVIFEKVKPSELSMLGELRQRCWNATYRGIYPDNMIDNFDYAYHLKRDAAQLSDNSYNTYFIRLNNKTVGYLSLKIGSESAVLKSLYILPEGQRKGIGTLAFRMVRQTCATNRVENFVCCCHPDNKGALTFYLKMGGKVISKDICPEHWQSSICFKFQV